MFAAIQKKIDAFSSILKKENASKQKEYNGWKVVDGSGEIIVNNDEELNEKLLLETHIFEPSAFEPLIKKE